MQSTDERLDLRHGLGLILASKIVEAHGGRFEIDNQIVTGFRATMSFYLIEQT